MRCIDNRFKIAPEHFNKCFIGYLIHNFSYIYTAFRSNWRIKALYALRNFDRIYAFTATTTVPFNIYASTLCLSPILLKYMRHYFTNLFHAAFPRPKEVRHAPLGVNFARSAHFTALTKLDETFTPFKDTSKVLPNTNSRITYPYATGFYMVLTPLLNNYLLDLFYRFLKLSLQVWFY